MKLTPFAKQIDYFESRRELEGVEKKSLTNPEDIRDWVDASFARTRAEDDGPHDFDPSPGQVYKSAKNKTVHATFEVEDDQRHLERSETTSQEHRFLRVHQTPVAIEAFWSLCHPDYPQLLECFRIDLKNPEASFYQRLEMGA